MRQWHLLAMAMRAKLMGYSSRANVEGLFSLGTGDSPRIGLDGPAPVICDGSFSAQMLICWPVEADDEAGPR